MKKLLILFVVVVIALAFDAKEAHELLKARRTSELYKAAVKYVEDTIFDEIKQKASKGEWSLCHVISSNNDEFKENVFAYLKEKGFNKDNDHYNIRLYKGDLFIYLSYKLAMLPADWGIPVCHVYIHWDK